MYKILVYAKNKSESLSAYEYFIRESMARNMSVSLIHVPNEVILSFSISYLLLTRFKRQNKTITFPQQFVND